MNELRDILHSFWFEFLAMPIYVRQSVIIILLALISGLFLFKVFPLVIHYTVSAVRYVIECIVRFYQWCIFKLMQMIRQRQKRAPKLLLFFETILDGVSYGCDKVKKILHPRPKLKKSLKKTYSWFTVLFVFLLPFLYHTNSATTMADKWDELEIWMLNGDTPVIALNTANRSNATAAEPETEAVEEVVVYVQLQEGNNGVNVRENPTTQSKIVDVLGKGEKALYLEQEEQTGSTIWYYVEKENGKTGWVSSNIVEKIEVVVNN